MDTAFLAQLVERKTFNLVVVGSSPTEGIYIIFYIFGNVPERSKGPDLSSGASCFVGSNPTVTTYIYFFFINLSQWRNWIAHQTSNLGVMGSSPIWDNYIYIIF